MSVCMPTDARMSGTASSISTLTADAPLRTQLPIPQPQIQPSLSTAGKMSNGEVAPSAARMAATVVGSSWIDAVFKTTSLHSSFDASPGDASRAISCAARIPIGVAALPRPSRFALTFAESGCKALVPRTFRKQAPQYRPERMRQPSASPEALIKLHHRTPQANSTADNYAQFDGGMRPFQRRLLHLSHGSVQASEKNGDDDHRRPYKTHNMTILLVFQNTC